MTALVRYVTNKSSLFANLTEPPPSKQNNQQHTKLMLKYPHKLLEIYD